MKHHYAHNLKVQRFKAGLTQSDLAHLLGCSQSRVCQIEAGTKEPTVKETCSLCVIYNIPVTELYRVSTSSALQAMLRRMKSMPGCGLNWRDRERRTKVLNDLKKRLEAYQYGIHA